MRKTTWILTLLLLSLMAEAQVVWFDGKTPVTYSVPKRVEPVVKTALEMWKSDMRQVTGMEPVASAKPRIKVVQGKGADDGFRIYIKGEIDADFKTEQQPSVAYRGIFLNDEDWSLRHWSYTTFEPAPFGHIGPKTYKKIFQLLLRLRANAVWPAMHEGTVAFFKIPGAKAMADSCGQGDGRFVRYCGWHLSL